MQVRKGNCGQIVDEPLFDQGLLDSRQIAIGVNPIMLITNDRASAALSVDPNVVPSIAFEEGSKVIKESMDCVGFNTIDFILHGLESLWRGYQEVGQSIRTRIESEKIRNKGGRTTRSCHEDPTHTGDVLLLIAVRVGDWNPTGNWIPCTEFRSEVLG